ncbi:MAG: hypothetical protein ACOVOR_03150 [Rhabdochlamydiaceae bacterium]
MTTSSLISDGGAQPSVLGTGPSEQFPVNSGNHVPYKWAKIALIATGTLGLVGTAFLSYKYLRNLPITEFHSRINGLLQKNLEDASYAAAALALISCVSWCCLDASGDQYGPGNQPQNRKISDSENDKSDPANGETVNQNSCIDDERKEPTPSDLEIGDERKEPTPSDLEIGDKRKEPTPSDLEIGDERKEATPSDLEIGDERKEATSSDPANGGTVNQISVIPDQKWTYSPPAHHLLPSHIPSFLSLTSSSSSSSSSSTASSSLRQIPGSPRSNDDKKEQEDPLVPQMLGRSSGSSSSTTYSSLHQIPGSPRSNDDKKETVTDSSSPDSSPSNSRSNTPSPSSVDQSSVVLPTTPDEQNQTQTEQENGSPIQEKIQESPLDTLLSPSIDSQDTNSSSIPNNPDASSSDKEKKVENEEIKADGSAKTKKKNKKNK